MKVLSSIFWMFPFSTMWIGMFALFASGMSVLWSQL